MFTYLVLRGRCCFRCFAGRGSARYQHFLATIYLQRNVWPSTRMLSEHSVRTGWPYISLLIWPFLNLCISVKKREAHAKQSMWIASDAIIFWVWFNGWYFNMFYKKSFELRGWLHVCPIEWKTSPWKDVIFPWKVLEKYLKRKVSRSVWTMVWQNVF